MNGPIRTGSASSNQCFIHWGESWFKGWQFLPNRAPIHTISYLLPMSWASIKISVNKMLTSYSTSPLNFVTSGSPIFQQTRKQNTESLRSIQRNFSTLPQASPSQDWPIRSWQPRRRQSESISRHRRFFIPDLLQLLQPHVSNQITRTSI